MPHNGSDLYYETVWASLSDGLKKRILAAVKKSMEASTSKENAPEVIIGTLSHEHQNEVDWLVVEENSGKDAAFIVVPSAEGAKDRDGIKLSAGMAKYLEHYVASA